jgi:hypothetical protein
MVLYAKCGTLNYARAVRAQPKENIMSNETNTDTQVAQLEKAVKDLNKVIEQLNRSVGADDWRVKSLLTEMYDTMVNNSCSHLWSIFVNDITGMPNLATRRYGGTVTLKFHFTDLEIPGDIADWEIEDKILEALADNDDLNYGNEDGLSVNYEEE